MTPDFAWALDWTVRITSVGVVITALEHVADRRSYGPAGAFNAAVFASIHGRLASPAAVGPAAITWVGAVLATSATALVALGPVPVAGRLALVVATIASILLRWRRSIGGDGAEQLAIIVLVAAVLAVVPVPGDARVAFAVAFVAAQAGLAYVTAGVSKLTSPMWRSGAALPEILSTTVHGHPGAARLLRAHPRVTLTLTWGVMLFEVLFPLLLLGPEPVAVLAVAAGVAFHAGCAVLMGLNAFVWAFPATYPCLLAVRAYLVG